MGHQLLDWEKVGLSSMDSLLLSLGLASTHSMCRVSYACICLTFLFSSSYLFWNSLSS